MAPPAEEPANPRSEQIPDWERGLSAEPARGKAPPVAGATPNLNPGYGDPKYLEALLSALRPPP